MSESKFNLKSFLDSELYPALYRRLPDALPEFGFKAEGSGFRATNDDATRTLPGSPKAERVCCYEDTPFGLKIHGGEFVTFIELLSGTPHPKGEAFLNAVKAICTRALVNFPDFEISTEDQERVESMDRNSKMVEIIVALSHVELQSGSVTAKKSIEYLNERGFSTEQIPEAGFGILPPPSTIKKCLLDHGFTEKEIETSALTWEKFQNRIVMPIEDESGRSVNLFGRWIGKNPPEGVKKILYLPGKGSMSTPFAFRDVLKDREKHVVIVESPLEAAFLRVKGDKRAISTMGSKLTSAQAECLITRNISSVTVAYDPDDSGDEGALSAVKLLLTKGVSVHVAPALPKGFDPDEFVNANGMSAWFESIASSAHGLRFVAEKLLTKNKGDGAWTDMKRSALRQEVLAFANTMVDSPLNAEMDTYFWDVIKVDVGKDYATSWSKEISPKKAASHSKKGAGSNSFFVNEKGTYFKDAELPAQRICAPLYVNAWTRDAQNEGWALHLGFKDREGNPHELGIPFSSFAGDGADWRGLLLDHGLEISTNKTAKERLAAYLMSTRPEHGTLMKSVPRSGWHGEYYVLPDQSFGPMDSAERIFLKGSSSADPIARTSGTLEEWRENVGRKCIGNSRLIFTVCAAVSGPLLQITKEASGGFNFFGGSSIGKSTALNVGGSVCGGGGVNGYKRSWRSTVNGMEGVAVLHCDNLLVLDELGQLDPREAGSTAYTLGNGIGKTRMSRDTTMKKPLEWQTLFISSSEPTFSAFIQEGGKTIKAGQEVRVVDIPGDAGAGLGLFENIHEARDANAFAIQLDQAVKNYYGTPLRAFLTNFVPRHRDFLPQIKLHRESFLKSHAPTLQEKSSQVQRVANRFALVAAAGELAISLGIFPWSPGEADRGVGKCFKDWLANRGHSNQSEIGTAIDRIKAFVLQYGKNRFGLLNNIGEDISDRLQNLAGFRSVDESSNENTAEWFIFPKVFTEEICRGLDIKSINSELKLRGYLIGDSEGKASIVKSLPGYGSTRVYHIVSKILLDGETSIDKNKVRPKSNFTGSDLC